MIYGKPRLWVIYFSTKFHRSKVRIATVKNWYKKNNEILFGNGSFLTFVKIPDK